MTHTEWVHVAFGTGVALMSALALWGARHPRSPAATVWPLIAFLIGVILFIPVESHTRTYVALSLTEVIPLIIPDDPANWVADWIRRTTTAHVIQHKIGGFAAMVAGGVETARARGRLRTSRWAQVLPACLICAGLAFGIHGGSASHLPFRMEQVQHQVLGVGLVAAGLLLGLHRAGVLRNPAWGMAWAWLGLAVGLNLALFYRLPPGAAQTSAEAAAGNETHDHPVHGGGGKP